MTGAVPQMEAPMSESTAVRVAFRGARLRGSHQGARGATPRVERCSRALPMVAGGVGLVLFVFVSSCANGENVGGDRSFGSNGERIYLTATSDRGEEIDHDGGRGAGGTMSSGSLSCASCHATDARGGTHRMHMDVMDAPNIRWVALDVADEHSGSDAAEDDHGGYDLEAFRAAVVDGVHGDGDRLSADMPRWSMSEADLRDLAAYLRSFEEP